ncbi:acyl-CoA N-acyltransferase [Mycena galericulata]|nr:acyl-CoA N-acyltransferase [Mycena galericulata]
MTRPSPSSVVIPTQDATSVTFRSNFLSRTPVHSRLERGPDQSLIDFHIHTLDAAASAEQPASKFVGTTGIFHIDKANKSCEVGILISPEYFRGGLATDALYTVLVWVFEERKEHRAVFQTGADNLAMRGWLESAGASLEGTQRALWADPTTGGYTDVCLFSILEEDWVTTVKGRLEARMNRAITL